MSKQENEARSIGKVTDYAEEKVATNVSAAEQQLSSVSVNSQTEEYDGNVVFIFLTFREAVKIVLKADDVAFLMKELDFTKDIAEKLLRKHKGDAEAALRAYIN